MKHHQCAESTLFTKLNGPKPRSIHFKGSYFRRSDGQHISKYYCTHCTRYFSSATHLPNYRQKKRKLNYQIFILLNSGVSQRRAALILRTNRKTIARKLKYLALIATQEQEQILKSYPTQSLQNIQFDDLETSEHTKCKPLSVSLAIDPKTRKILSFQVSKMPAKGKIAALARSKYGKRNDERPKAWNQLFKDLKPITQDTATFYSDQNPHYSNFLKKHFPNCTHLTTQGGRGCIVGQGELKKLRFDPLFALNHTCAMLRANLNRLFRKTWCTTKTVQGLIDHLAIYVAFHNLRLT